MDFFRASSVSVSGVGINSIFSKGVIFQVNNYVTTNGAFVDSWRLTKGTLELWLEIQASLMKNLSDLSKEIIKYHDELVKSRKRAKEYDVLDAVNLMQTTTTCLQKVNFLLGIKKNIKNKNKELFKV